MLPPRLNGSIPRIFLAALAAALLLPLSARAEAPQLEPSDERIRTTKVEATLAEKTASIQVYCFSKSARLWIDRKEAGWVPFRGDLEQGTHYLEVRIPGYYPLGHWFVLAEKTLYTLDFAPERIVGKLELEVEPKEATVLVDGAAAAAADGAGVLELPAGRHRLEIRRFGYAARSLDVVVRERETERVAVSLEKAAFAVEGFRFARESFNPRSVGSSAANALEFRATSYGSARVAIVDAEGAEVAAFDFPAIEDWSQRRAWAGIGPGGASLPEGLYTARLVAFAAGSETPIEAEAKTWIDASLVVRAYGAAAAIPGLLYLPDPVPAAAGTVAVEAFCFAPTRAAGSSSAAFGIATAFSATKSIALGLHASAELGSEPFGSGDLDGSALASLFGDKTSAWSGALFVRGGYSSLSRPAMPGAGSLVEASLPLGARLGGIGGADARAALAPGIRADFSGQTEWLALGRAALWLEGKKFRSGISGEIPLGLDGGASAYRGARSALEGRLMLGAFVAAAYATADFAPDEDPAFGFGLGLGLLF